MIKVLGRSTSGNVQKVLFFLEETATAYEREDFGKQFGNTRTSEYLAMNPTAKVPTVVDGDTVLWESNSILRYLAAIHAPELTGADAAERAAVERWMDFLLAAINPGYIAAFKGAKLDEDARSPEYAGQVADLVTQLGILDGHLDGREHFALERLTIADIALAPIVRRCVDFDIDRPSQPNLERWIEAMTAREAFARASGAAKVSASGTGGG